MSEQNNNLESLVNQRVNELPESVIDAIESIGLEKRLQNISKSHDLHLDKWGILESEIMLTILGITDPDNLVEEISEKLNIELLLSQTIVNEIAEQVFVPIREEMQLSGDSKREMVPVQKASPSDTTAYKVGEVSTIRKEVNEDPYRESIE